MFHVIYWLPATRFHGYPDQGKLRKLAGSLYILISDRINILSVIRLRVFFGSGSSYFPYETI